MVISLKYARKISGKHETVENSIHHVLFCDLGWPVLMVT